MMRLHTYAQHNRLQNARQSHHAYRPVCQANRFGFLGSRHPSNDHMAISVATHAQKATEVENFDDLATGWRVDPEGRVSKQFNPRDLLKDCNTWQECQALMQEQPQRFERNNSLSYHLLNRLVDLIGPEDEQASNRLLRHVSMPVLGKSKAAEPENADPFAQQLRRTTPFQRVTGQERTAAMKLFNKVIDMVVANMDKMRPDDVTGFLFVLARMGIKKPMAIKAVQLYLSTNAKRCMVAELFACLAVFAAMQTRIPPTCVQAIVAQAQRGMRHATIGDLSNAVYGLHVVPRGLPHASVNSLMRAVRPFLYDLSGDTLAFLVAMIARQGYKPPARFSSTVVDALAPRLESFSDPHSVVALLYGLGALKQDIHEGITAVVERIMVTEQGMKQLEPAQLAVLSTVLATAGHYTPSSELKEMYLSQLESKLSEVEEASAPALLAGLAYMSSKPQTSAPKPVAKSAVAARLAKLAAKRKAEPAPPTVGITMELIEMVETRIPKLSPGALLQLTGSIAKLQPTLTPDFTSAFHNRISSAPQTCATYSSLITLCKAASSSVASLQPSQQAAQDLANAVAAQAMKIAEGPKHEPTPSQTTQNVPQAESDVELDPPVEVDYRPTSQERDSLLEALSALPGVSVEALTLPEAQPLPWTPPPQPALGSGRSGRNQRTSRQQDNFGSSWYEDNDNGGDQGWFDLSNAQLDVQPQPTRRRSSARSNFSDSFGMVDDFDLDSDAYSGFSRPQRQQYGSRAVQNDQISSPATQFNSWRDEAGYRAQSRGNRNQKQPVYDQDWYEGDDDIGSGWFEGDTGGFDDGSMQQGYARSVDMDDGMGDGSWGLGNQVMQSQGSGRNHSNSNAGKKASSQSGNGFADLMSTFDDIPMGGIPVTPEGVNDALDAEDIGMDTKDAKQSTDDIVSTGRRRRSKSSRP